MKKLIGLLAICFVFSLSALAQHEKHAGGARPEVGGGHQNIPKGGPAKVTTPHPAEENRKFNDKAGHPKLPTYMPVDNGWGMIPAGTTLITIWIIRGSMVASPVVSGAATSGTSQAVVPAASGSAVSTFPWLPTTSASVTAGSGIRTKSASTTIPITPAGISPITFGSESTPT